MLPRVIIRMFASPSKAYLTYSPAGVSVTFMTAAAKPLSQIRPASRLIRPLSTHLHNLTL
jgi:hypothetical protein